MAAPTDYEIGAALNSAATLVSQGCINPEAQFVDFSSTAKLESGLVTGLGFYKASWHFGYLYKDQFDVLKSFSSGAAGAAVCISTLNNEMSFVRYNCNMEIPLTYPMRSTNEKQVYQDVTIEFTELIEAE